MMRERDMFCMVCDLLIALMVVFALCLVCWATCEYFDAKRSADQAVLMVKEALGE